MSRVTFPGGPSAAVLLLFALAGCQEALREDADPAFTVARFLHEAVDGAAAFSAAPADGAHEGLLRGRVTTEDGEVYEGRLRFGGDEEALWGNYFNGAKSENPWVSRAPSEALPKERLSFELLGLEIGLAGRVALDRPFMARFGDIARIEPRGRDVRVTLKSGTDLHIDRFGADDLADGLRVWDQRRGVVDLGEWRIRSIELLPGIPSGEAAPAPLYGTVHTRQGEFTGFVQWNREACLGSDELDGLTTDGRVGVPFDAIRSIARRSRESSLVTLVDGREIVLSGTPDAGDGNRGMYVDDARYGRVLVSWDAFEQVDFRPGGNGPAYGDFPSGRPLSGTVVTRSGRRLTGRLVYDLDESETTETLDAPRRGVDYLIPFDLVASVELPTPGVSGAREATVTLRSGEELRLELAGDLGEWHAGMLVFQDGRPAPEYLSWTDVARVDFDGPRRE